MFCCQMLVCVFDDFLNLVEGGWDVWAEEGSVTVTEHLQKPPCHLFVFLSSLSSSSL